MNTLTTLCAGLCDAVLKDEAPEAGGFDLSAGMFGPNVSQWMRDTAKAIDGAAPVAPAESICPACGDDWHPLSECPTQPKTAPVATATLLVKRSLIESAIYTIQQSDTSSGCCMCGDSMSTHDNGMYSGHAPCDSGDYHAQGVLKELREALS